jgi:hypothetical protein
MTALRAEKDALVLVPLLLGSIVFLTALLIAGALMLRGQWEKMGVRDDAAHERRSRSPHS